MSAPTQTKIFGIRLGIDPKILVGGLIVLAGALYWFNSRSDDESTRASGTAAVAPVAQPGIAVPATAGRARGQRRRGIHDDRGTLKLPAVVPANGDIDPVLRLGLLRRLSKVEQPGTMRNLFESGPASEIAQVSDGLPKRIIAVTAPKIMTPPAPPTVFAPPVLKADIPLKYYGFARPSTTGEANRGFFLDAKNDIVVAAEGQMVEQKYRVVQLTPVAAKMEDTQLKLGETLPVMAEAAEQGAPAFGRSTINPGVGQAANPGFPTQNEAEQ